MTIGNFAALLQSNVKRMLAYSSIAHAGYVLVALTARSAGGHGGGHVLPGGLCLHEHRRVRGGGHLSGKGEQYQNVEDFARPGPEAAAARPPC